MEPRLLEYRVVGDGHATVVLLPGGLTGWQSWDPIVPLLARGHRVVNVQLVANAEGIAGRSADPSYTTDVERESLRLTLEQIHDAGQVHLVGWSNGGRAAIDFAIAYRDTVSSLIVVEPAAWWLATTEDGAAFGEFVAGIAGRDLTADDLVTFLVGVGIGPAGTDFRSHPSWPVWYSSRNALSWFSPRAVESAKAGVMALEAVDCPVLCVRGTGTSPWLSSVVEVLLARLPDASLLELDGGHAALLQNSAQFAAAVTEHVRSAGAVI
jgi:pimeloyl-ACP methyl ester carboxylesterase